MKVQAWIALAIGLTGCTTIAPVRAVAETDCSVMASGAAWALSHPAFENPRFHDLAPSYAFVGSDETPNDWSDAVLEPTSAPLDLRRCAQFQAPAMARRRVGTTFYQRRFMKGGQAPGTEESGRLWISRPVYDKQGRRAFLAIGYGCNLWSVTLTRRSDGGWDAKADELWFLCVA